MGAEQSRLTKAGGDSNVALQGLSQFMETQNRDPAMAAMWDRYKQGDPTAAQWVNNKLGQSTKGKFSGPLGAIGKVVSTVAPFALPLIPGIGPLAAGLGSAAIGKLSGKSWGQSALQGAGSAAGSTLLGGKGFKGIGDIGTNLKNLGNSGVFKTIGKTFKTPTGGLDLGKLAGVGMAATQLGGQRAQRQSAQARLGAEDQVRNQLLSRLLERPNYNFTPGQ